MSDARIIRGPWPAQQDRLTLVTPAAPTVLGSRRTAALQAFAAKQAVVLDQIAAACLPDDGGAA